MRIRCTSRLDAPSAIVTVDGVLDEEAWTDVVVFYSADGFFLKVSYLVRL